MNKKKRTIVWISYPYHYPEQEQAVQEVYITISLPNNSNLQKPPIFI